MDEAEYEVTEEIMILIFLYTLESSEAGVGLDRHTKRLINKAMKKESPNDSLIKLVAERFSEIRSDNWGITEGII